MTKRHFERLAKALREQRECNFRAYTTKEREVADAVVDCLAQEIASICAQDNPRFDKKRFIQASAIAR